MRIAYQGVAGAYSHIASMTVYPGQEYLPCDTFEKAMKLVSEGEADLAMIPVENSNAGRVSDVHFLLPQTGLHIIGEFFLPINHQLLGLPGTKLADVKSASSHPQALAQCSEFLKRHGIKPTARIDTALSCQDVLKFQDKSIAAIASKLAGEIYGLDVVAPNVENARNNTTRFLIMAREPEFPKTTAARLSHLSYSRPKIFRRHCTRRWAALPQMASTLQNWRVICWKGSLFRRSFMPR